jgi:hypothetical protein
MFTESYPMAIILTIAKVFGLSLMIAVLIKYAISRLAVPQGDEFVLMLVLLPTIVVASWLARQSWTADHE